MGLTIRGRFDGSPSYDMGYVSFFQLRKDIAYSVSEEYGKHYEELSKACAKLIDVDAYNARTEWLIKKYHCKERFLSFLYQSDCSGKLSPFKCKALLDQIADVKGKALYGYTAYPENCLTMDKFKELLRECFNRRKYLEWY